MDFNWYSSFFHDGCVTSIRHVGTSVDFFLQSVELNPVENKNNLMLDEKQRLKGRLVLRGIRKILVNEKAIVGRLTMKSGHDEGDIMVFEIKQGILKLGILWAVSHATSSDYSSVVIEAKEIIWEDSRNNIILDLTGVDTTK